MIKQVLFSVTFSLLLAQTTHAETSTKEPIQIGALLCLTGECAEMGNNSLKGINLALKEINAQGGILGKPFTLIVEDSADADGGAQAVAAFQKLSQNKKVQYFIGPTWSTGGLSLAPIIAKRSDIVITAVSVGVADFNEAADNIFNVWPHDEFATTALAEFAITKGWKKVAIFSSQHPWETTQGNTFEAELKLRGGTVATKVEPLSTIMDLRVEVFRIVKSEPDVVFLANYNQMGVAAKQLRQAGYKGPILAILADSSRIKTADGALEGAIFAHYPEPSENFINNFVITYGAKPNVAADTGYDALYLYAKAIEATKSFEVKKVKKALLEINHQGASGLITFDEKGGVIKQSVLYKVVGEDTVPLNQE